MSRTLWLIAGSVLLCAAGTASALNMGLEGDYLAASVELDQRAGSGTNGGTMQPPYTDDSELNFAGAIAPDWYAAFPSWIGPASVHWELGKETTIKTQGDASMRITTADGGGIKDIYVGTKFPTTPGVEYTVSFDYLLSSLIGTRSQYAVRTDGSLAANDMLDIETYTGHERPDTVKIDAANFDDTWHTYSKTFTATGTEASLIVYLRHGDGPDGLNNYIDNVVLVPEPASLALLSLGGLALWRRRRSA